jgi:hypothetical protein
MILNEAPGMRCGGMFRLVGGWVALADVRASIE